MNLNDIRWEELESGYRVRFDPRPAIDNLERDDSAAWDKLWEELYHQGDVGTASFAAVPLLIEKSDTLKEDWNLFALAATIEEARGNPTNPPVPDWIASDYSNAWLKLERLALQVFPTAKTEELVCGLIAVLAHSRDQSTLARMALLTEDERVEMLNQADWG